MDFKVANRDVVKLYPDIRTRLARVMTDMKDHFKPIFIVEGYRSFERQNYLYAQGRTFKDTKKVTNSMPGDSLHNYGLAIDVAFKDTNPFAETHPWEDLKRIVKAHGFTSGADFQFVDRPHIQLTYGLTLKEIKGRYSRGGLESVWGKIDSIRGVPIGEKWLNNINNLGG